MRRNKWRYIDGRSEICSRAALNTLQHIKRMSGERTEEEDAEGRRKTPSLLGVGLRSTTTLRLSSELHLHLSSLLLLPQRPDKADGD